MTAPIPDPNDARDYTVQRWEPFILGLLGNIIHQPAALAVGLQFLHAAPDAPVAYMVIHTEAAAENRARHYYKISVEHIEPPPPDTEGT